MISLTCGIEKKIKVSKDNKYREKTSGYQLGEEREEGQFRGRGVRGTNY